MDISIHIQFQYGCQMDVFEFDLYYRFHIRIRKNHKTFDTIRIHEKICFTKPFQI
jgi:hypothetical protein